MKRNPTSYNKAINLEASGVGFFDSKNMVNIKKYLDSNISRKFYFTNFIHVDVSFSSSIVLNLKKIGILFEKYDKMRYDEKEEKGVPMFRDILYSICNSQVKQIEKRQKDLALDTEAVILSRNQPYKEKYSPSHLYDVYQPRAIEDPFQLPLIITIHGGAFIVGDKKYHRYYSGFIAVQNYQIAPINFRVISEKVNLKEEIQDIFDAINDVVKVFKGFPRLYIMGESAGAMLAILVCAIWNDPKLQKKFGVKVPDYKLSGLALIACPYNHQLYPKFMAPINYSSNKMYLLDVQN